MIRNKAQISRSNILINIYNNAYKSYLSHISPTLFLHTVLSDILNLFNASGLLIRYDEIINELNVIACISNDSALSSISNYIQTKKIINEKSPIIQQLKSHEIQNINNCKLYELLYDNTIDDKSENNYILLPFHINDISNGIMILCGTYQIDTDLFENMNYFCQMMGILFNNIHKNPLHNIEQINLDTIIQKSLNTITDKFIIIDTNMQIVYKNKHYEEINNIINEIPNLNYLYKNKKLSIHNIASEIYINTIIDNEKLYHIIIIHDYDITKNTNSQDLIAYLSHEIRNPIQVITDGVYIIDKSIKNIDVSPIKQSYVSIDTDIDDIICTNDLHVDSHDDMDQMTDSCISHKTYKSSDDKLDNLNNVLKRVSSACNNMNVIIGDILDLTKYNNGELVMNIDKYNLRELSDLIMDQAVSEAFKKDLTIEYEYNVSNAEFIFTDSTRLFQIITNLLSNAIKYSTSGIIKFNVSSTNDSIIFQITDQGKGIKENELCNLFKQYGRTSDSMTDIRSSGLGLYVCQKISSMLGGYIDVKSEYTKGSTFSFIHPQ